MSKMMKSPRRYEIEAEMIRNGEQPFYDWHGDTTNLSDQERFEHFKKLGFIPQDAKFEDWKFSHVEVKDNFTTLGTMRKASDAIMGTIGKARKNKIVPIEEFDINCTPNEITIKKFTDPKGKEMVEMWYEL